MCGREMVSGRAVSGQGVSRLPASKGFAAGFTTAAASIDLGAVTALSTPATFRIRVIAHASGLAQHLLACMPATSGSGWRLEFTTTGGGVYFLPTYNGVGNYGATPISFSAFGREAIFDYVMVMVSGSILHYVDGVYINTSATSAMIAAAAGSTLKLGSAGGLAQILSAEFWGRELSAGEIRALYRTPLAMLREPHRWAFPAAAGGTTLVLADAAHDHAADAVVLVQQHQLAAADASHPHAADAVTLTQQHQLSADDAAHIHLADAVALIQQHQLAAVDAIHGHTADAVALVQQHAIAIADAMHAHDLDALTLAVQSTLSMSDATHAHGADGVTLSLAGSLAVADATHGHAVDPVPLTQQHLMALADALHAHGSDVVTLGTGLVLAVVDAVHAQTADTLAISQLHLLVLADAAHAHLTDTLALVMPGAITTLPDRTLVIAAEHRALVIVTESRALAIGAEARVLTIH